MDLALNNLQRLMCHKTQTTNQSTDSWIHNVPSSITQYLLDCTLCADFYKLNIFILFLKFPIMNYRHQYLRCIILLNTNLHSASKRNFTIFFYSTPPIILQPSQTQSMKKEKKAVLIPLGRYFFSPRPCCQLLIRHYYLLSWYFSEEMWLGKKGSLFFFFLELTMYALFKAILKFFISPLQFILSNDIGYLS